MISKQLLQKSFKTSALTALLLTLSVTTAHVVSAETLESPNYRIDGATIGGGGDISESGTGDYTLFSSMSVFSGNPRIQSTSYEIRGDNPNTFLADTPEVACFETTSSGSSNCTTASSYINSNGMVRICGSDGCYNRARIEIDPSDNPSDTLYGVQISDDNFVSDLKVIDGTSKYMKDFADRDLADYLTESAWETDDINIRGLQSNTQYWVRIVALHGDLTESSPSPVATATTAQATVTFDIDITDTSETDPETAAPYTVAFTGSDQLFAGGAANYSSDLIWLDMESNADGGVALVIKGLYGGLYSATGTYTITSATADLASTTEGFGLQNFDHSGTETYEENYSGQSDLGEIAVETAYNGTGQNVGIVDTDFTKMYDGDGPIDAGRTATYLRARASTSAPAQSDYTEDITFVIVGRY